MGNGDIVVGSITPPRNPADATIKDLADSVAAAKAPGASDFAGAERHCGAMSQQCGNSDMLSAPQKFVRLVGCRDPKSRPPGGG